MSGLNEALLTRLRRPRSSEPDKVRADTTVVETDVAYPTDSGFGQGGGQSWPDSVPRSRLAPGLAHRRSGRDSFGAPPGTCHRGMAARRSDDAKNEARAITGEMVTIAERAIAEAGARPARLCKPRGADHHQRGAVEHLAAGDVGLGQRRWWPNLSERRT